MHPAIELILKRMGSNPEEFTKMEGGRWDRICNQLEENADADDKKALLDAMRRLNMDTLHRKIMKELCTGEIKEDKAMQAPKQLKLPFDTRVDSSGLVKSIYPISPLGTVTVTTTSTQSK